MVENNEDILEEDKIQIYLKEFFVGFIDILGFRNNVNGHRAFPDLAKVYLSLLRVIRYLPEVHITKKPNYFYKLYGDTPSLPSYAKSIIQNNLYNFSDSIIFYIESSDGEDNILRLNTMCWIANAFIAESIITDPRILQMALRGAIAFGPAIMDSKNKIHVGGPIIDAFDLSNKLDWMGGALHSSVNRFVIPDLCGHDRQIIEYQIPIKGDYKDKDKIKYALNWVQQHPSKKDLLTGNRRPQLGDIGKAHVLKYDWGNQKKKREETMRFVETICNAYDNNS